MTDDDFREWLLNVVIIVWNDFEYKLATKIIRSRVKAAEWAPEYQVLYPAAIKCVSYGDLVYVTHNDWSGIPQDCERTLTDFLKNV